MRSKAFSDSLLNNKNEIKAKIKMLFRFASFFSLKQLIWVHCMISIGKALTVENS